MQIRHVVTHHWRAIVFLVVLVVLFLVIYALRSVLLPFMLGLLIAYILHPAVLWLEKALAFPLRLRRYRRAIIVSVMLLLLAVLIALVASYMVALLINTVNQLLTNASDIFEAVTGYFSNALESIRSQFSPDIQARIDEFVASASREIGNAIENLAVKSITIIPSNIGAIFGFAALPAFLFYVLKDWERLRDGIYRGFTRETAIHTRNILAIIGLVLGRYLRAQLLLGTIVGSLTFIGLLLMRVNIGLALVLGIIAGVFEMVPSIGPWISGLFAVLIILATYPDLVLWVIGLFLMIQLLENNLLVPRIEGQMLQIHPAIALMLLVLGAYLAGLWGILLVLPLTATIIQIFRYTYDAARFEDHLPLIHHDASIFEK